ncbi:MAG: putative toxin-antitoxin system toxin component, PIN family [Chloroflexi bacterium]|nr:putative toxin-antitoxin system toxin component, PIN family [Chloroflexota bacterium]
MLASGFAGFLHPASSPGQILRAWRDGRFELVISEHILSELRRLLTKPCFRRWVTAQQVASAEFLLRHRATLTAVTVEVTGVATHPEDDEILAAAVSAPADYLVTGDTKLLKLGSCQGVSILSPRAFLELLASDCY